MREANPSSQFELDPHLASCFGSSVGIVRKSSLLPQQGQGIYIAESEVPNQLHPCAQLANHSIGNGLEPIRRDAINISVAEALERYGATCPPFRSRIITASYNELKAQYSLPPIADVTLYSPEQLKGPGHRGAFELKNLSVHDRVRWIEAYDSKAGKVFYPHDLVHMEKKNEFCWTNTSGFAIAADPDSARESALGEVLERDAFLTTWWLQQSPPVYGPADLRPHLKGAALEILNWLGDRVSVLDLTHVWGAPVFVTLIFGCRAKKEGAFVLGAACKADPQAALFRSIREAYGIFRYAGVGSYRKKKKCLPPYEQSVLNFEDCLDVYLDYENKAKLEFLVAGERPGRQQLGLRLAMPVEKSLVSAVHSRGARVITLDMTPIDLHLAGLTLVRAVVPEAIPLNTAHFTRPLGCPKLRHIPVEKLNSMPHPFP